LQLAERSQIIPRARKPHLSAAATLLALALAGALAGAAVADAGGEGGDLVRAELSQAGQALIFSLRTAVPVGLAKLDRLPQAGAHGAPYLCLALSRAGHGGERRICLGGKASPRRRVGLESLNAAGKVVSSSTIAARVKRPQPHKLVVSVRPEAAALVPARYRWRVVKAGAGCQGAPCTASLPARGARRFRLRPVRAVGCTGGGAQEVFNGDRDRKVVALTFDDGPSEYTEGFLDVLHSKHVHGTFFEIGQEMPGREGAMRRILREGDEIGDHTMNHVEYPGYGQIAGAASRILAYTHFRPCLFRPPGGAVDSSVIATAGSLGMETILWDVDPADWTTPGSAAVYSRVVGAARPGSIILMHDGGGNRSGTLAALPRIIDTLRGRGYGFATVSQLLGHRLIYRPYG
jgi:peptidoglycan-N-acetylglucosamine deacetylase